MPEELVVRHCSPTLAGLKTGNMFTCRYDTKQELYGDISVMNKRLRAKGLRAIPLRFKSGKALIYIYRPPKLERDFCNSEVCRILVDCGYKCSDPNRCITKLMSRLREDGEFPHEIGLFLGYPPEDVEGFIEHRQCKLTGFWKVYGNEEQARRCFERFEKCTRVYTSCYQKGCPLERLAVEK